MRIAKTYTFDLDIVTKFNKIVPDQSRSRVIEQLISDYLKKKKKVDATQPKRNRSHAKKGDSNIE